MPPKATTAAKPSRTTLTHTSTARKPALRSSATKSASQSAAASSPKFTPPSAATTTTLSEPVRSLSTTKIGSTPESALKTTLLTSPETNLKKSEGTGDRTAENETISEKAFETAAIEAVVPVNAGGSGQERKPGVRTVVKRTVKVVKKVVKKKVPKKVQKGQAVSSGELKLEGVDNGTESSDPRVLGAMEVVKPNSVEPDPEEVSNSLMEVETHNPAVAVLIEAKNPNSFMEVENSNPATTVLIEAENPSRDPSACNSVSVENSDLDIYGSMQVERTEILNINSSEVPVSDVVEAKNTCGEGDQVVSTPETQLGDQNVLVLGSQNDGLQTENVDDGLETENVNSSSGEEVAMVDGLVLSGEMEALERRKRRRTEVFVGGLDKDAKEEDVRKVFQEVGELVGVRLVMNDNTGKNKGFAFVRYASASDAKKALTKFASVEICGKQCGAVPVEGNDTIFLGNIDKKWKSENIVKLLQEIGIERIDNVSVLADPNNIECNRGFAFLELQTCRDAQIAYRKLQKKDVFGKNLKIKVAWAEPLSELDEEEMLKVKSIYAEYLPSSWDEEKVKDYFKKFGEIENVVLSRNLRSSKRKDFAFVKYTSREAAFACIEAFSREPLTDEGSEANVKVSLAKPLRKGKQVKHVPNPVSEDPPEAKIKPAHPFMKPHQPSNTGKNATSSFVNIGANRKSSTTDELVHLLREQASWRQPSTGLGTVSVDLGYSLPSTGRKRPLSQVGGSPYSDPRGYPRARFESSFPATIPRYSGLPMGAAPLPYNHPQGAGYASGSLYRAQDYPKSFQARGGGPYHGSSGLHRI